MTCHIYENILWEKATDLIFSLQRIWDNARVCEQGIAKRCLVTRLKVGWCSFVWCGQDISLHRALNVWNLFYTNYISDIYCHTKLLNQVLGQRSTCDWATTIQMEVSFFGQVRPPLYHCWRWVGALKINWAQLSGALFAFRKNGTGI